ncbi:hypothetical protein E0H22_25365 [Rhodopseudomonas boonkerdii]|uniref:hypothetical protein n=1 Tax=Rhodopseudomonas boonkerdii TaxID=475937 RepID=UPI001E2B71A6|nr:hypothetical protein [Rhodopseudomonas boonkerdii]UGV28681.1 hypothetical protein E0H22_25365 [Rhodopseudomonas boonkerdii]
MWSLPEVLLLSSTAFLAIGEGWIVLALGCAIVDAGAGSTNRLPPLIAQQLSSEYEAGDVVAKAAAVNQATYSLVPIAFDMLRSRLRTYVLAFAIASVFALWATLFVCRDSALVLISRKSRPSKPPPS